MMEYLGMGLTVLLLGGMVIGLVELVWRLHQRDYNREGKEKRNRWD